MIIASKDNDRNLDGHPSGIRVNAPNAVMRIAGSTRVIGYFGATFAVSRVYDIYNYLFPKLGMDFVYVPFQVEDIGEATRAMRALGIHAVGVTIPFKTSIIPHLDVLDTRAKRSGAVNVVLNDGNLLRGDNTDGLGALKALEEKVDVRNKKVLLIGAGGAARAIASELIAVGAAVTFVSIDEEEAIHASSDCNCNWALWDLIPRQVGEADIIINATPLGMIKTSLEGKTAVPRGSLESRQVVMDILVSPTPTRLLADAKDSGCTVINGERMLLWQALLKFEIFTGFPVDLSLLEEALRSQHDKNP